MNGTKTSTEETKHFKGSAGKTEWDRVKNDDQKTGTNRKGQLNWCGHVGRTRPGKITRKAMGVRTRSKSGRARARSGKGETNSRKVCGKEKIK